MEKRRRRKMEGVCLFCFSDDVMGDKKLIEEGRGRSKLSFSTDLPYVGIFELEINWASFCVKSLETCRIN